MEQVAFVMLPVLAIATFFLVLRDKRQYQEFESLQATEERQAKFRQWLVESFLCYGLAAILCLGLIGHFNALLQMPDDFDSVSNIIEETMTSNERSGFFGGMIKTIGYMLVPALLLGPTATGWRRGRVAQECSRLSSELVN